jgi:hypothetical protein
MEEYFSFRVYKTQHYPNRNKYLVNCNKGDTRAEICVSGSFVSALQFIHLVGSIITFTSKRALRRLLVQSECISYSHIILFKPQGARSQPFAGTLLASPYGYSIERYKAWLSSIYIQRATEAAISNNRRCYSVVLDMALRAFSWHVPTFPRRNCP